MPKCVLVAPPAAAQHRAKIPWSQTSIYEVHVRSFTRNHPGLPLDWRGTFRGLGSPEIVAHFVKLGITTLEIMPAMAWVDERHLGPLGLSNIWGYNPVAFCAPDPRLAPGGWVEIRTAIAALQAAGIEVLLDVVLNHSGEGDALGPTLSLRGLDNASYYRLHPDNLRRYIDDAGCGNILALDRPPVVRLAMDALRTWAERAGLDGFRFDLATTLARRDTGFDAAAPLITAITQDPLLRSLKLIAEPWDIGPGGYQPGNFPAGWGEWNDRYRDEIRRFWRGDGGFLGALATRLAGSAEIFSDKRRPSRGINFITAHDGFTLADLVAYEHKHNEANGEHNYDGTAANHSWNHGVEGAIANPEIIALRLRDQRNLLATLFLSRGTPMLSMGSELCWSQQGNNNAYAQDLALDWTQNDGGLTALVAALTRLRREHPALHEDRFPDGEHRDGLVDVQWLRPGGGEMSLLDWERRDNRTLVAVLSAPEPEGAADRVMLMIHAGFEPCDVVLAPLRIGFGWILALDTSLPDPLPLPMALGPRLELPSRSVVVLVESRGVKTTGG